MGSRAAMTVKVARIVGLPTSSTALTAGPAPAPCMLEVAVDVLDDDDGVVDEDADGEDQGKEGHAVERVAVEVVDEQRQGQGHRDGDGHDDGLAPPRKRAIRMMTEIVAMSM